METKLMKLQSRSRRFLHSTRLASPSLVKFFSILQEALIPKGFMLSTAKEYYPNLLFKLKASRLMDDLTINRLLKLSQNHLDSGICSVNAVGTNHRVPFLKTRRLFWLLMLLELHLVIYLEPSWKRKDRERRRCQLSAQEMTDLTALTVYLDRDSQAPTATLKQRTSGSDKLR